MFKDYYLILEISPYSSVEEIKIAYRSMSIKWHPDKNEGRDVTSKMQDINEAYAILKDTMKRKRYDEEYIKYKRYLVILEDRNLNSVSNPYAMRDEQVERDIKEARDYAKKLVDELLMSLHQVSKDAVKGAVDAIKPWRYFLVVSFIISLIAIIAINQDPIIKHEVGYESGCDNLMINEKDTYIGGNGAFYIDIPCKLSRLHNSSNTAELETVQFQDDVDSPNFYLLLQYTYAPNNFIQSTDTVELNEDTRYMLRLMIESALPRRLNYDPIISWITIKNRTKACKAMYSLVDESGDIIRYEDYYLFNGDEMARVLMMDKTNTGLSRSMIDETINSFRWRIKDDGGELLSSGNIRDYEDYTGSKEEILPDDFGESKYDISKPYLTYDDIENYKDRRIEGFNGDMIIVICVFFMLIGILVICHFACRGNK